jgi:hypothetical protein
MLQSLWMATVAGRNDAGFLGSLAMNRANRFENASTQPSSPESIFDLYAFSSENWKRPAIEVQGLMRLLERFQGQAQELNDAGVRLQAIGRLSELPEICQRRLAEAIATLRPIPA